MAKLILVLGVICLIASVTLSVTYYFTAPLIAQQESDVEEAALKAVMEDASNFKIKEIDGIKYYEAYKQSALIGYCLLVKSAGYSSEIRMMVGIDERGIVKGVRILSHEETPGLGDRITEVRQGEKEPWFVNQFKEKDATTIELSGIDAITGATISSQAVVSGIKEGVNDFLERIHQRNL